ncbi:MBL fold metallo-hydrolase [Maricaulis sp.]|uniref:MBL fold metallo-hydrolase n=1 Tax=Maricaulis sp. TaxID=1486257 RepID=UPI00260D5A7C|nr:MBL fold metallo-hydrolase [Maricaulis sp.]
MKTLCGALALFLVPTTALAQPEAEPRCTVELVVLGVAQDGGAPQMGNPDDPAWADPSLRRLATSIAVVDRSREERYLFEATPDMREQLQRLDEFYPVDTAPGLDGIFLTHGHVGHYAGLIFLGFESMGAREVPVHVMPSMGAFLFSNGPWDQLVRYQNIVLEGIEAGEPATVGALTVTPFEVPHRQEYTEVVGFRIEGPDRTALFLPDIDSWEEWETWPAGEPARIEEMIASVDVAYLDATFFANGEIPGRDMSGFPHPFITHSMDRFADLPAEEKAKIRFIHFNHTNPVRFPDAPEREQVFEAGFGLADEGERYCLGD